MSIVELKWSHHSSCTPVSVLLLLHRHKSHDDDHSKGFCTVGECSIYSIHSTIIDAPLNVSIHFEPCAEQLAWHSTIRTGDLYSILVKPEANFVC